MLNMADSCQKTQEMTLCIEEADAIDALEKLQEHENEVFINQLWIFQFPPVVDSAENIPPRLSLNLHSAKFSASSLDDRDRHE